MNKHFTALRIIAGLILGVVLCGLLFEYLDVHADDWRQLWLNLSWLWVGVVLILSVVLWWSGARKWALWSRALHGDAGAEPAPGFYLQHMAWQTWFGQFLPPTLAIVLGRSWATRHMPGVHWKSGVGSGIYDQGMEFLLLSSLLPAAIAILHFHVPFAVWFSLAIGGLAVMAGLLCLARRWLPASMKPSLAPMVPALVAWSVFRVVVMILRLVAGAPALSLMIDGPSIAAAAPVVALLMIVPLTPGNLGIAEWGWVGVLSYAGTDPVAAGLLAMGYRLLIIAIQSLLLLAVVIWPWIRKRA